MELQVFGDRERLIVSVLTGVRHATYCATMRLSICPTASAPSCAVAVVASLLQLRLCRRIVTKRSNGLVRRRLSAPSIRLPSIADPFFLATGKTVPA